MSYYINPLFVKYGQAKKPFGELTAAEMAEVNKEIQKSVRARAWAAGSPVYYSINGVLIAEYEDGKKIIVEKVNGELAETREYEE